MSGDKDKPKEDETEKKVKDALKSEAVKVHPKGTVKDIKDKIEKKGGKK